MATHTTGARSSRTLSLAYVSARTVPELKDLCTQAGLPKTGKKQDLIDRLAQHPAVGLNGGLSHGHADADTNILADTTRGGGAGGSKAESKSESGGDGAAKAKPGGTALPAWPRKAPVQGLRRKRGLRARSPEAPLCGLWQQWAVPARPPEVPVQGVWRQRDL